MKTIYLSIQKLIVVIGLLVMALSSQAQVLDLESTTEGALLPRMTTVQRTAITAATLSPSEMVYDTDTKSFWYWEDMQWNELGAGGTSAPVATFYDCGVGISSDTLRNTLPAVRDTITLTSTEVITPETHVSICLDVYHTFVGDLNVNLISPNTTSTIGLSLRNGAGGDNFKGTCFTATAKNSITSPSQAPFTGVFLPEESLSALVGETIAGDWTLEIADVVGGDDGIFNNWEINFTNSFSLVAQQALTAISSASLSDDDNDTKIQVEESADEDIIRFDIGGTERLLMSVNAGTELLIEPQGNFFNTFFGRGAGANTTSSANINTFVGDSAGGAVTSGFANTLIGEAAGQSFTTTGWNTVVGMKAGQYATGQQNVFMGNATGANNTGSNNTFLGGLAGNNSGSSSNSVFIGQRAGYNETANQRLYIDGTGTSTANPLIYGEFDSKLLRINGDITTNSGSGFFRSDTGGLPASYGVGVRVYHETTTNTGRIFTYDYTAGAPVDMTIQATGGRLAIGGAFATGYKLSVDGKAIVEELVVELSGDWPDYVFENDYDLKPLSEVKSFIDEHGHLPNVPSAKDMESSDGIAVGEMQRIMIEKIEELTLYMIELEAKNEALTQEVAELKKK